MKKELVSLHTLLSWDDVTEKRLRQIEDTPYEEVAGLVRHWRNARMSWQDVYLLLALASARWVDHRGPFIGHGTFNGGAVLRASSILSPRYKILAVLQMAGYVFALLRHPNYGPYVMLESFELAEDASETVSSFISDLESGEKALLSEHRAARLVQRSTQDSRWLMLWAALRQYPENEHRLLIVQRAFDLLDDTHGWRYAEAFYRAAIQYLGNRPQTILANQVLTQWPGDDCPEFTGTIDIKRCEELCSNLVAADFGQEANILMASIRRHANAETVREAIALASSALLYSSAFDAHAVTGVHSVLDLVDDSRCPSNIRHLAWVIGLSSSRTRRQKQDRARWTSREAKLGPRAQIGLDHVIDCVMHDPSGQEGAARAQQFLLSGGDPEQLAGVLMEISLTTSEPFDAIHNVKMLWGLLNQTRKSLWPERSWIHLSAGARVVAMSVNPSGLREDIDEQWRQVLFDV